MWRRVCTTTASGITTPRKEGTFLKIRYDFWVAAGYIEQHWLADAYDEWEADYIEQHRLADASYEYL